MITPDQAQELLRGDFASEVRERMVGNLEAGFTSFDGAHIEGTPGDFALTEAAPALAELVAGMHYEYAVQLQMSDGEWHFTDDEYYPFGTPEPRHAEWQTKTGAEELYASLVEDDGPKYFRIVRRLVGESEVVE